MSDYKLVPEENKTVDVYTSEPAPEEVAQVVAQLEPQPLPENKPIVEQATELASDIATGLGYVIAPLAWIVAFPFRLFTWFVTKLKTRAYDPEKMVCPACGFKGDDGTNGKSCAVRFVRTKNNDRANIQHHCFRCGCDEIFSKLFSPADKWLPR